VILLTALLAGALVGVIVARKRAGRWRVPAISHTWLALVAFIPQLFLVYLPLTRLTLPDAWAAVGVLASQVLLLGFCWLNRRIPGMPLLGVGLAVNLLVMAVNGGFMPISPQTAERLVPAETMATLEIGSRFGWKDILLRPEDTTLAYMSDVLLPPRAFPYQVAFSPGDVLVALGAFWLMAAGAQLPESEKRS
jgi:Family of unknown function (DUF5317)